MVAFVLADPELYPGTDVITTAFTRTKSLKISCYRRYAYLIERRNSSTTVAVEQSTVIQHPYSYIRKLLNRVRNPRHVKCNWIRHCSYPQSLTRSG